MHDLDAAVRALGSLQVRRCDIFSAALPMKVPFAGPALSRTSIRPAVYVRVLGDNDEEGWGECAALGDLRYAPESSDLAARVLRGVMAPALLEAGELRADEVRPLLDSVATGWSMSKAAMEAAILDALLHRASMSLAALLGATRSDVPAGAAVGFPSTAGAEGLAELTSSVRSLFDEGYERVRVKVSPRRAGEEWTVRPLRHLREQGITGVLQPDGNGSFDALWDRSGADALTGLRDCGVRLFEQPLSRRRWADSRALGEATGMRIGADESAESFDDVRLLLDGGYFGAVCVKWSRVGGILEAARIVSECARRRIPVFVGGMLGVGTHADAALAACIPEDLDAVADLGPAGKWIDPGADPAPPLSWSRRGRITVPTVAGISPIEEGRVSGAPLT